MSTPRAALDWRRAAAVVAVLAAAMALPRPVDAQEGGPPVTVISGGTILPVSGPAIEDGVIVIRGGKITQIGPRDAVRVTWGSSATVIDARGKWVTPGLIDTHSHMGCYSWPSVAGNFDGNEMTSPIRADVRIADSVNVQDPAFERARAGGVTVVQVLPGSGNLVGGQGFIMKLRKSYLIDQLRCDGARRTLKMAVGENPKRVYGGRNQMPSTRMGNAAALRQALTDAAAYRDKRARHAAKAAAALASGAEPPEPMEFDAKLDVLADLLDRKVDAHIHCYRQDELLALLALSREFGFRIAAFHHGLEGYKVADEIAAAGVGVCTWPDWWGYKVEMWDGIPWNAQILAQHGVRVSVHSDSANTVQRLYHEAAKMVMYGVDEDEALRMITINPAWMLGIDRRTGSLEPGKDADIAIFTHHPFDIYTRVAMTLIDGDVVYTLSAPAAPASGGVR